MNGATLTGEKLFVFAVWLAGVSVEVQYNELFRMSRFEAGEEFRIAFLESARLFVE